MGFLQPSWLGRRWQPWYQDLLDLAGIKGMLHLAFMPIASSSAVTVQCLEITVDLVDTRGMGNPALCYGILIW